MPAKPHARTADVVFFDPGETTGVAVLAIDPRWLAGEGDADWAGLRKAIRASWFAQIGAEPSEWDAGHKSAALINDYTPHQMFNGPRLSEGVLSELNMIYDAREILDYWPSAAWGYEDYRVESMAGAQRDALVAVRFFATLAFGMIMDEDRPRVPFVQDRSMKSTATNSRMQSAGLYLPGLPHATDAARHAALFLRDARQHEVKRRAAWPRLFDPARIPNPRKRKAS